MNNLSKSIILCEFNQFLCHYWRKKLWPHSIDLYSLWVCRQQWLQQRWTNLLSVPNQLVQKEQKRTAHLPNVTRTKVLSCVPSLKNYIISWRLFVVTVLFYCQRFLYGPTAIQSPLWYILIWTSPCAWVTFVLLQQTLARSHSRIKCQIETKKVEGGKKDRILLWHTLNNCQVSCFSQATWLWSRLQKRGISERLIRLKLPFDSWWQIPS